MTESIIAKYNATSSSMVLAALRNKFGLFAERLSDSEKGMSGRFGTNMIFSAMWHGEELTFIFDSSTAAEALREAFIAKNMPFKEGFIKGQCAFVCNVEIFVDWSMAAIRCPVQ
jgi:hypothetical protein